MDFGKLSDISTIDFTLPDDHPRTTAVLGQASGLPFSAYVGCARWGNKEWVGSLYPKGTKASDYLKYYVRHFNTIELNATHYRIFPADTIHRWRDMAGSGFLFCPKFYNVISHRLWLRNAESITKAFYTSVERLEASLGPLFLQMSDSFGPAGMADLERYVGLLPQEPPVFLELRHPEWYATPMGEKALDLLEAYGIGSVITDVAGRRDCLHQRLTTPVAFIRFGGNALHASDYARIDAWVERLKHWRAQGLQRVFFFMHQQDDRHAVTLSAYLTEALNREFRLQLPIPQPEASQQGELF